MPDENVLTVFSSIANCKVIGAVPKIKNLLGICPSYRRMKNDPRYNAAVIGKIGSMVNDHLLREVLIRKTDLENRVLADLSLQDISHIPSIVSDFLFGYINCFWLQFDNSFILKSVYAYSAGGKLAYNEPRGIVTTADGLFVQKELDAQMISQAERDYAVLSFWDNLKDKEMEPRPEIGLLTYIPVRDKYYMHSKLSRAYLLVTQARVSQFVPIKLAFYVIALECLFSNDDKSEVNHKVSERAAYFIGTDAEERIGLFRKIKKLYDVRSKFVHGQSIKPSIKELSELSVEIDEVLRRIFRKLIDNKEVADLFLGNQKVLDEYYLNMIF